MTMATVNIDRRELVRVELDIYISRRKVLMLKILGVM
jgi:hypothetical protein